MIVVCDFVFPCLHVNLEPIACCYTKTYIDYENGEQGGEICVFQVAPNKE